MKKEVDIQVYRANRISYYLNENDLSKTHYITTIKSQL